MSQHVYHDEEELGRNYDSRLLRRLLAYLIPYWKTVCMGVVLLLTSSALQLAGPILTKIAIDTYIAAKDYTGLLQITGIYVIVVLVSFILQYLHNFLMNMTGQRVMRDMRNQIFHHLQNQSLSFFDRNPVGRLMTRLTTDVDTLNEMFTSGVVAIFGDLFILAGIVVVLIYMNLSLALMTFAVLPLLFIAAFIFKTRIRGTYREIRIRIARINSFLQENISGMRIVQLFTREKLNYQLFKELNARHMEAHLKTVLYFAVFMPTVEIISALAIALIIWYGGFNIIQGTLTLGALVAFVQYAQRFYRPIQDLSEKYNILQSAMAASERIFRLLDREERIPEKQQPRPLLHTAGTILFDDVWFAYKGEDWVLKDISFQVQPAEKIALVGATGSGKTTIINLLSRFYDPQRGSITLDGVDLKEIALRDLRRQIGVVLQDVFLFSGTIGGNIGLETEEISSDRIQWAAREVNADTFINNLPGQFEAEVKERGATLSTGQKQLIAFARALAYDPKILVLDEATSNIDTESERLIQRALKRLMENRTSIIIAHRLSTIQNVDNIIVLHKGKIREVGTHQQLLKQRGIYYKLYQLQYKEQEMALPV